MNVIWTLVYGFTSLALVLTACAPASAPPPAAAPTAAPRAAPTAAPRPAAQPTVSPQQLRPTAVPDAPRPAQATPTPVAAMDEPKRGGWLVAYGASTERTMDPNQESSIFPMQFLTSAFHRLVTVDPDKLPNERSIVGQLAERWEVDKSAQKWTFYLKSGYVFHDGQPLTSADVKATLERMRDTPGGIISPLKQVASAIETVGTPDATTVVITTKRPAAWMLTFLAQPTSSIVPAHIVSKDQKGLEKKPIGSGPFKFSVRESDVKAEFVRNDKNRDARLPYLDGYRWLTIREAATQFAAIRTGRVNFTGFGTRGLSKSEADLLTQRTPGVKISRYGTTTVQFLWLNTRAGPFKDVRVRQAAAKVIDQREIIDIAHEGAGFKGDFTGPAGLTWSLPEDKLNTITAYKGPTAADIADAKKLLAQAGYPDGFRVEWLLPDTPGYEFRLAVETKQLAKIGITVNAKISRYPVEWVPALREGRFTIGEGPIPDVFYDPDALFAVWITGSLENRPGLSDAQVDDLYTKQGLTVDPVERKKVVDQLQLRLWELAPAIPTYNAMYHHATLPEIRGWTHPGILRDNFWYEKVWIAQ